MKALIKKINPSDKCMTFGYCNGQLKGGCKNPFTGSTTVWGDGEYTYDSSPCNAAIHQGVITKDGGVFQYWTAGHKSAFSSSSKNGVSTSSYSCSSNFAHFKVAKI